MVGKRESFAIHIYFFIYVCIYIIYLLLLVPEQAFWNKFWLVREKMEMKQPEK